MCTAQDACPTAAKASSTSRSAGQWCRTQSSRRCVTVESRQRSPHPEGKTAMGLSKRKPEPFLRAGDWVEVRSAEEILGTLDGRGRLDSLPFMPEMLQFCGKRFRVYKSAHKTCDTIATSKSCWMVGAVHLEGLRCSGAAHGGCQAQCLLFWKKAWLKPVRDAQAPDAGGTAPAATAMPPVL